MLLVKLKKAKQQSVNLNNCILSNATWNMQMQKCRNVS